ncbi:MAG: ATP-binding protein [Aestuariibacter sp.]
MNNKLMFDRDRQILLAVFLGLFTLGYLVWQALTEREANAIKQTAGVAHSNMLEQFRRLIDLNELTLVSFKDRLRFASSFNEKWLIEDSNIFLTHNSAFLNLSVFDQDNEPVFSKEKLSNLMDAERFYQPEHITQLLTPLNREHEIIIRGDKQNGELFYFILPSKGSALNNQNYTIVAAAHLPSFLEQLKEYSREIGFNTIIRKGQTTLFSVSRIDSSLEEQWGAVTNTSINGWVISTYPNAAMISSIKSGLPQLAVLVGLAMMAAILIALHFWQIARNHARSLRQKKIAYSEVNSRLELAAESVKLGTWEWDFESDKLVWDNRLKDIYEIKEPKDCGGMYFEFWRQCVHPDDIEAAEKNLLQTISSGNTFWADEFRIVVQDGKVKYLKANGIVVRDDAGSPLKMVGTNTDVTQQKELQQTLTHMKEQADAANAAKSEFLANMSHEIRTPMNGVFGVLQVLQQNIKDKKQKSLINDALTSAKSLLTIINDILDFSKIEAGMLSIETTHFLFSEIIDNITTELRPVALARNNTFSIHFDDEFDDGWTGDPIRVKQILLNIASNAVKFTEGGEIAIDVSNGRKGISRTLQFTIRDTGIGMTQEQVTRLFNRFDQADSSTRRKYGGTGLGMTICKSLIEMMEGTIEVRSIVKTGTKFIVNLPIQPHNCGGIEGKDIEHTQTPDLNDLKVLVAEDNEINQVVIDSMLDQAGVDFKIASNGKEAVDMCGVFKPRVVLMDIQMPVMDGVAACKIIKEVEPQVKIVALTANVLSDQINLYADAGFDDCVEKPVSMQKLYSVLARYAQPAVDSGIILQKSGTA